MANLLTILLASSPWAVGTLMLYALLYRSKVWQPVHHLIVIGCGAYVGYLMLALVMYQLHSRNLPVFSEWLIAWGLAIVISCWVLGEIVRQYRRSQSTLSDYKKPTINKSMPSRLVAVVLSVWLMCTVGFVFFEIALRPTTAWDTAQYWSIDATAFLNRQLTDPSSAPTRLGYLHPATVHLINIWGGWSHHYANGQAWLFAPFASLYLGIILSITGLIWSVGNRLIPALVAAIFGASMPMIQSHAALSGYAELWIAGGLLSSVAMLQLTKVSSSSFIAILVSISLLASVVFLKGESIAYTAIGLLALVIASALGIQKAILKRLILGSLLMLATWMTIKGFDWSVFGTRIAWIADESLLILGRRRANAEIIDSIQVLENLANAWMINASFGILFAVMPIAVVIWLWKVVVNRPLKLVTHYGLLLAVGAVTFLILAQGFSAYLLETANELQDTVYSRSSIVAALLVLTSIWTLASDLMQSKAKRRDSREEGSISLPKKNY